MPVHPACARRTRPSASRGSRTTAQSAPSPTRRRSSTSASAVSGSGSRRPTSATRSSSCSAREDGGAPGSTGTDPQTRSSPLARTRMAQPPGVERVTTLVQRTRRAADGVSLVRDLTLSRAVLEPPCRSAVRPPGPSCCRRSPPACSARCSSRSAPRRPRARRRSATAPAVRRTPTAGSPCRRAPWPTPTGTARTRRRVVAGRDAEVGRRRAGRDAGRDHELAINWDTPARRCGTGRRRTPAAVRRAAASAPRSSSRRSAPRASPSTTSSTTSTPVGQRGRRAARGAGAPAVHGRQPEPARRRVGDDGGRDRRRPGRRPSCTGPSRSGRPAVSRASSSAPTRCC